MRLISPPEARIEAPAAEIVDHRDALGQLGGLMERRNHARGADANPLGLGGDRRRCHRQIREGAIRREVVLGQPDFVVAEFVGPARLFEHVGENLLMSEVIGLVAEDEHAEPHADTSVRNIVAVTATILHD